MSPSTKNGLLVASAVVCGLVLSAKPWALARAERASAAAKVRQAQADETRMVRDRTEEGRLGTELGKEELLRAQGYRKAGEQTLNP